MNPQVQTGMCSTRPTLTIEEQVNELHNKAMVIRDSVDTLRSKLLPATPCNPSDKMPAPCDNISDRLTNILTTVNYIENELHSTLSRVVVSNKQKGD